MLFQFSFCYIYRERDLGTWQEASRPFYIPSNCFNFNFGLLVQVVNAYFNFPIALLIIMIIIIKSELMNLDLC